MRWMGTSRGASVVLLYGLADPLALASMQGYACGFKDACPGVQGGLPFRVVIIESSASEGHLRASMGVLKSLAKPRRFSVGYRGFNIRELQLLRLPSR